MAQHRQRAPLAPGRPLGVQPDEDHEQRDERHGQPDDHPGQRVGDQDPDRDGGRDHRGDEQRGQVAAEVALEPVEPAGGQRGQLAGRRQAGVAGAEPQDVRDQGGPQGAHDVGRRTVRGDLARPRQPRPDGHHREHAEQGGAKVAQACPAEERVLSTPASSWACTITRPAVATASAAGRDDEPPRGRSVPQQPRVEGSHRESAWLRRVGRRPVWAGMSARADAAAEHPERPGLVGQHDGGEHGRHPGHDRQGVRRGRGVRGGQAEGAGSCWRAARPGTACRTSVTVTATIATVVSVNAQPSRPRPSASSAADQRARSDQHRHQRPELAVGEERPHQEQAAEHDDRDARLPRPARRARSRTGPVVFSARKTAPWKAKSASVVSPPSRRVRVEQGEAACR